MVTVSQNKLGVAINLLWRDNKLSKGKPVRCSIDLIPTFTIEEEDTSTLTSIVNEGLFSGIRPDEGSDSQPTVGQRPPGWFKSLVDYVNRNKMLRDIDELNEEEDENAEQSKEESKKLELRTKTVMLKILNYCNVDYYYIRPGMRWKENVKFKSENMHNVYCMIKGLLKGFKLVDKTFKGVDQFMAKQVLRTTLYEKLERELEGEKLRFHMRRKHSGDSSLDHEEGEKVWNRNEGALLLHLVLNEQYFKLHFDEFINFDKWDRVVKTFKAVAHEKKMIGSGSQGNSDWKRLNMCHGDIFIPIRDTWKVI